MATSPAVDPNLTLSLAPPRLRGLVGPGATPYSSLLSRSDIYSNLSCSWWCECWCCCFPVTTTLPITTRWQTLSFWLILYFELLLFLTSFLSNFLCVQARLLCTGVQPLLSSLNHSQSPFTLGWYASWTLYKLTFLLSLLIYCSLWVLEHKKTSFLILISCDDRRFFYSLKLLTPVCPCSLWCSFAHYHPSLSLLVRSSWNTGNYFP